MNSLNNVNLKTLLKRLHSDSNKTFYKAVIGFLKGKILGELKPEYMENAYLSMTDEQGKLMYGMIRAKNAKNIVEFGTSFGISTLYLAAAAKDNGGKVITTELLTKKCKIASQNFAEAGLSKYIELKEGDAMQTLRDINEPIDFLLLDGWKDLYLPLFKMLEPKLSKGAIIITDNTNFNDVKIFLKYIHSQRDNYFSTPLKLNKGSTEFSVLL
jgi:predicted O-methyltransferase YrrM